MKRILTLGCVLMLGWGFAGAAVAEDLKEIKLPKPRMEGGKPLMQALKARASSREFGEQGLTDQVLSDLLWAACGVNRPDGKRTAPTAMDRREIEVYVALTNGLFFYDAAGNTLKPILAEDIRTATGQQPFVKSVPVNLVFVADYAKMTGMGDTDKMTYAAADTGYVSQNVYLFCASEGLATVVRGWVDRKALEEKMKLRPDQHVILTQSIGYPKK